MSAPLTGACALLAVGEVFPDASEPLAAHLASESPAGRGGQLMRMDRLCGLAMCATDRALLSLQAVGRFKPETTAVVLGSAYGCHKTDEDYFRGFLAGQPSPRLFAYTLPSSPIGEVSIHHGLRGPGLSIVTGRTAGLEALCEAQALLAAGQASACMILGCEVAAPALPMFAEDAELCDGAVALLLAPAAGCAEDADFGQIIAATTAFRLDDPLAAIVAVRAELLALEPLAASAQAICDPQTHACLPRELGTIRVQETPRCGAAAPLAVLAGLSALPAAEDGAGYLLLAADPAGFAAAVLWQRIRSATSRTAPAPPGFRVT